MPESKKISELPAFSTVQSGDILPIVDASLTQTGKCTAAQIAQLGGGAPGLDTVSNKHVVDSGLQARKLGFTASDRIAYSTTTTDTVEGATRYRCTETPITSWARGLIQQGDAEAGRLYLNALASTKNAYFEGQTRFGGSPSAGGEGNTAAVPCIVRNASDWSLTSLANSGIFFPDEDSVAFSIIGVERWRIQEDGYVWTPLQNTTTLKPGFACRAFVYFSGTALNTASVTINANQRAVAARYGLAGTLADNQNTREKISAIETARGVTLVLNDTNQFTDSKGKGVFYIKNKGTETRANYTTPGDNKHYSWVPTATPITATSAGSWQLINAYSGGNVPWIGTASFNAVSTLNPIYTSANIASVRRSNVGEYVLAFENPFPAPVTSGALEGYAVLTQTNSKDFRAAVTARTDVSVTITTYNAAGNAADVGDLSVAIFR